jgi:predicted transcriptional regulator
MKIGEIKKLLDGELLTGDNNLEIDVSYAFGCDLMSDVLALSNETVILLTGLTNIQSVRTAEMLDIKCIVFVRGKKPERQVVDLAKEKGICLIATRHIMFTSCGILYSNGIKGANAYNE